jgi:catechol 2,3-dioxygenase-like lactoylglutathione lyase family enzyme
MTIQRTDHVGVVVDDLAAAIAFFIELGMELEGGRQSRDVGWTRTGEHAGPP